MSKSYLYDPSLLSLAKLCFSTLRTAGINLSMTNFVAFLEKQQMSESRRQAKAKVPKNMRNDPIFADLIAKNTINSCVSSRDNCLALVLLLEGPASAYSYHFEKDSISQALRFISEYILDKPNAVTFFNPKTGAPSKSNEKNRWSQAVEDAKLPLHLAKVKHALDDARNNLTNDRETVVNQTVAKMEALLLGQLETQKLEKGSLDYKLRKSLRGRAPSVSLNQKQTETQSDLGVSKVTGTVFVTCHREAAIDLSVSENRFVSGH